MSTIKPIQLKLTNKPRRSSSSGCGHHRPESEEKRISQVPTIAPVVSELDSCHRSGNDQVRQITDCAGQCPCGTR